MKKRVPAIRRLPGVIAMTLSLTATAVLSAGAAAADEPSLFTDWTGHGRGLQLSPNGTGTLRMASGAANADQWNVDWVSNTDGTYTVTIAELISQSGLGSGVQSGSNYIASYQVVEGETVLHFLKAGDPPSYGFDFCTPYRQGSGHSPCGA